MSASPDPRSTADPTPAEGVARPAQSSRRRWRWDASLLVAIVSVTVALVYNAFQARDSGRQVELSRQALELTVRTSRLSNLLDLHAKIVDADRATSNALLRVRASDSSPKSVSELISAITPLEGIAFALQHGLTGIPGAVEMWRLYLVCAFFTARDGVGPVLDSYVPALARFTQSQLRNLGPSRRCTLVLLPRSG